MKQGYLFHRLSILALLACWALLSFYYLKPFGEWLNIPIWLVGLFSWGGFFFLLHSILRHRTKELVFVFLFFASLAWVNGPYLEPPIDPLEHLRRGYHLCDQNLAEAKNNNLGLLHYSMSALVLCGGRGQAAAEVLFRITFLHGLFWGLGLTMLYGLGRRTGLSAPWSLFHTLLFLLFFGTNRFSYFQYYSFAPSFTSLVLFWWWLGFFWMKHQWKDLLMALLVGGLLLLTLKANHLQEVVFLAYALIFMFLLKFHEVIWGAWQNWKKIKPLNWSRRGLFLYGGAIFLLLFILPQFEFYYNYLYNLLPGRFWFKNQPMVIHWMGGHWFGNIWHFRVHDTLGLMGLLPLLVLPLFFFRLFIPLEGAQRVRLILFGVFPFLVYLIPFFHVPWLTAVRGGVYYRICYMAVMSIPLTWLLASQEQRVRGFLQRGWERLPLRKLRRPSFSVWQLVLICLIPLLILAETRRGPVYGKLDFLQLEGVPWWPAWKPMIEEMIAEDSKVPILTDPITSQVLQGVFGLTTYYTKRSVTVRPLLEVTHFLPDVRKGKLRCWVNMQGFQHSWVPSETRHWRPAVARTDLFYRWKGEPLLEKKEQNLEKLIFPCKLYP